MEMFWGMEENKIETILLEEVENICWAVPKSITIDLNGRQINAIKSKGNGPYKIVVESLPHGNLTLIDVGVDIYVGDQLPRNGFTCNVELFHENLYLCSDSMDWIMNESDISLETRVQARLHGTIIRCFLPRQFPINFQKDGIAIHRANIGVIAQEILNLID